VCGGKEDYGVRESGEVQKGTGVVFVSRQKGNFFNSGWVRRGHGSQRERNK
jgi:hypothetical protein